MYFGKYKRGSLLGEGACGSVWELDGHPDYVVKFVKHGSYWESSTLAWLNNRGIGGVPTLLSHARVQRGRKNGADGIPYVWFVMERIHDVVSVGSQTETDIYELGQQIKKTLVNASKRYVHRDVKPENIMKKNGKAFLVDWGTAMLNRKGLTGRTGTEKYMSFAVHFNKTNRVTHDDDKYSLGLSLLEMALHGTNNGNVWHGTTNGERPQDEDTEIEYTKGRINELQNIKLKLFISELLHFQDTTTALGRKHTTRERTLVDRNNDKHSRSCMNGNTGTSIFYPPVLTARNYKPRHNNPTGWWASEKWDGYRAIWDGSKFISRNGHDFNVPIWFSALMPPNVALDGELWVGRGSYEKCGLFRKKTIRDIEWIEGNVQFNVFDIPSLNKPFEERMIALQKLVETRCSCVSQLKLPKGITNIRCPLYFTPQIKITSAVHLDNMFNKVVEQGGEGLMIRQPGSLYEKSRSSTLLKYKVLLDTECQIVGYKPGNGKYSDALGSFECQLIKGNTTRFYVSGMTDEIRKNYKETHPQGTIITIKYNDLTKNGIPRHPRYLRKRSDHGL
jgi:DNA ligase-1